LCVGVSTSRLTNEDFAIAAELYGGDDYLRQLFPRALHRRSSALTFHGRTDWSCYDDREPGELVPPIIDEQPALYLEHLLDEWTTNRREAACSRMVISCGRRIPRKPGADDL
jgi:hypothetical protein